MDEFELSSNNQSPDNMKMAFVSPDSEGGYTITEGPVPEGFKFDSVMQMSSPTQENPEPSVRALNGDQTAYVRPLQPGETVRVTFKNSELGKIVVEKQTIPDGSEQAFTFVPDYDEVNFQLQDGQSKMSPFLMSGTYNVEELVPMGWQLFDIDIIDATGGTTRMGNGANIDLAAGETVRLVFNNTRNIEIPRFFFRWDPIYPDGIGDGLPFYGPDNRNNQNEITGNSSFNLFQPDPN